MLKSSASASKNASRSGASSSGDSPGPEPPPRLADPRRGAHRLLQALVGERDRLPVVAAGEVQDERLAADLVEHLAEPADVADGLGHLRVGELQHPVVHPHAGERLAAPGQRLRRLVLVVREDEVDPAAVDVEVHAQVLLGHRGALDVPAGAARRPTASPRWCPRPPWWPSRARSRAGPPCDRRPRRPRPGPSGPRRGPTARRSPPASARGSRRRRPPRRRARPPPAPRSGR